MFSWCLGHVSVSCSRLGDVPVVYRFCVGGSLVFWLYSLMLWLCLAAHVRMTTTFKTVPRIEAVGRWLDHQFPAIVHETDLSQAPGSSFGCETPVTRKDQQLVELAAHFSRWSSGIPTFIDGFKGFHEATHVMESCAPVMRVAQRAPPRALRHSHGSSAFEGCTHQQSGDRFHPKSL